MKNCIWKKLSVLALALILVFSCIPANVIAETADESQNEAGESQTYIVKAAADDAEDEDDINWYDEILAFIKTATLEDYRDLATTFVDVLRTQAKDAVKDNEELKAEIDTWADKLVSDIEHYTDREFLNSEIDKYKAKLVEYIFNKKDSNNETPDNNNPQPSDNNNPTDNNTKPTDSSTKPAETSSKIDDLKNKAVDTIAKRLEQAKATGDAKTAVLAAGMEATNAIRKATTEAEINKALADLDQKIAEAKMVVKGKSLKAFKKKKTTFGKKKAFKIQNAPSKLTFTKINKAGKSKIKVSKAGKITVKKGLKKGTYKVKVRVVSKATPALKAIKKETTVKIKVK
jgi:hypothetical protein